jgi:hypothetical protein
MEKRNNFRRVKNFFNSKLEKIGYNGVFGAADFKRVCEGLMPVQRKRLENICSGQFQNLMKKGSIICIGIAYPEHAIDCIDVRLNSGTVDKSAWNLYAREYHTLNRLLNTISENIAEHFGGKPISATMEGITVKNVEDYYRMTISHRVIAENAGFG